MVEDLADHRWIEAEAPRELAPVREVEERVV
jgi:hypothetical protein